MGNAQTDLLASQILQPVHLQRVALLHAEHGLQPADRPAFPGQSLLEQRNEVWRVGHVQVALAGLFNLEVVLTGARLVQLDLDAGLLLVDLGQALHEGHHRAAHVAVEGRLVI